MGDDEGRSRGARPAGRRDGENSERLAAPGQICRRVIPAYSHLFFLQFEARPRDISDARGRQAVPHQRYAVRAAVPDEGGIRVPGSVREIVSLDADTPARFRPPGHAERFTGKRDLLADADRTERVVEPRALPDYVLTDKRGTAVRKVDRATLRPIGAVADTVSGDLRDNRARLDVVAEAMAGESGSLDRRQADETGINGVTAEFFARAVAF